jgi:hypothetical protein
LGGVRKSLPRLSRGGGLAEKPLRGSGILMERLTRLFHTRHPFGWVAQATRLCRSATRRPEPRVTHCSRDTALLPKVPLGFPPGQWPGGTGESPVPPRNYEMCRLNAAKTRVMAFSPLGITGLPPVIETDSRAAVRRRAWVAPWAPWP